MNIGIVTTWFERGSAHVSRQYAELLCKRHNIFIYSRGGEEAASQAQAWNKFPVWATPPYPVNVPAVVRLKDFHDWIKSNKIELVFFNEEQGWDSVLMCNRLGVKIGAYIDYYTEETIPFFERYDFLICNTKRHFSAFDWHPGAHYVPWGTDIDLYKPQQSSGGDVVRFFHSAGFNPHRKGTDFILRAFEKIDSPNAKLIIHSQVALKAFYPKLEKTIERLTRIGRLECHERTVGAPGLYHLGDVYLYPSRLDGIGLTLAEALACGLPVITCDAAPMNEFVNSSNGWLAGVRRVYSRKDGYYWPVQEIDEDDFLSIIQEILRDPSGLKKRKALARAYAVDCLNWKNREVLVNGIFEAAKLTKLRDVPDIQIYQHSKRKIPWQLRAWSINPCLYSLTKRLWSLVRLKK